jgi:hypothetical protein
VAAQIGGLCVLKGTIIYATTLTFAGLYTYFILEIFQANGKPPTFDPAMVSASAALAGSARLSLRARHRASDR